MIIHPADIQNPAPNPSRTGGAPAVKAGKILKMVKNERMGGFVPAWMPAENAKEQVASTLSRAGHAGQPVGNALQSEAINNTNPGTDEFGFADLLDMVNPLQHLPLIGHLYRELTGDEIKPASQIIGGAVFGGAIGAGSALINVVIQEETGQDITGNALALAFNTQSNHTKEKITDTLENAAQPKPYEQNNLRDDLPNDFPGALLAFTNLGHENGFQTEKIQAAQGRTAGNFIRKTYSDIERTNLPPREPITQISMKSRSQHYND